MIWYYKYQQKIKTVVFFDLKSLELWVKSLVDWKDWYEIVVRLRSPTKIDTRLLSDIERSRDAPISTPLDVRKGLNRLIGLMGLWFECWPLSLSKCTNRIEEIDTRLIRDWWDWMRLLFGSFFIWIYSNISFTIFNNFCLGISFISDLS